MGPSLSAVRWGGNGGIHFLNEMKTEGSPPPSPTVLCVSRVLVSKSSDWPGLKARAAGCARARRLRSRMHGSRSVGRAPPGESAQEAPEGSRGAQCLPCSTAPGSSFPWPQTVGAARPTELPSLRGKPQQEPLKRAAGERGSRRLGSAAAPPTPGRPRMLPEEGPPPASNPRAPDSRSFARARARGRGQPRGRGGCARAPSSDAQNFPQLPQLSCALTVRLPGLPRGPSRSSSAPWRRRRTIGGRSLGGGGWGEEQAPRCRPSPNT